MLWFNCARIFFLAAFFAAQILCCCCAPDEELLNKIWGKSTDGPAVQFPQEDSAGHPNAGSTLFSGDDRASASGSRFLLRKLFNQEASRQHHRWSQNGGKKVLCSCCALTVIKRKSADILMSIVKQLSACICSIAVFLLFCSHEEQGVDNLWILGGQYHVLLPQVGAAIEEYMTEVLKQGTAAAHKRWTSHYKAAATRQRSW